MKKETRFYVTPLEIAGVFGTMGAIYAAMPWDTNIPVANKIITFISAVMLGVVVVGSIELIGETVQDLWRARKTRKARRMDA